MFKRHRHHEVPHENGWAVRREGAQRASSVARTKEQAVEHAHDVVLRECGAVIIRCGNGTIQKERTCGNDPFPQRG